MTDILGPPKADFEARNCINTVGSGIISTITYRWKGKDDALRVGLNAQLIDDRSSYSILFENAVPSSLRGVPLTVEESLTAFEKEAQMELLAERARLVVDPVQGGRVSSFAVDGIELLVAPDGLPTSRGCYPMAPWAGRGGRFVGMAGMFSSLAIVYCTYCAGSTVEHRGTQSLSIDLGSEWPWDARQAGLN